MSFHELLVFHVGRQPPTKHKQLNTCRRTTSHNLHSLGFLVWGPADHTLAWQELELLEEDCLKFAARLGLKSEVQRELLELVCCQNFKKVLGIIPWVSNTYSLLRQFLVVQCAISVHTFALFAIISCYKATCNPQRV